MLFMLRCFATISRQAATCSAGLVRASPPGILESHAGTLYAADCVAFHHFGRRTDH
jgi:hypothetical protein